MKFCHSIVLFFTILVIISIVESASKDYYKILGVSRDADARQIKKAYREQSKKWHPDVAKTDDERERFHEKMVEINRAYEILNDPEKKRRYDMFGDDEDNPQAHYRPRHHYGGGHAFNFGFDFEDIMGDMFGFGRRRQPGGGGSGGRQCVQTVTCKGNVCTQTTRCTG